MTAIGLILWVVMIVLFAVVLIFFGRKIMKDEEK